jgi:GT2 family glycosyltransferase
MTPSCRGLISVILTTRNRVESLRRCLDSLQRCKIPAGWKVEVLVVDNGCNDDARKLVASMSQAGEPTPFRYLCEPRQGKTFAVNRGVAAANGRILAFLDDDVVVDQEWLTEIVNEFDRDTDLGLIAGLVAPVSSAGPAVAVTRASVRTLLNDLPSLEGFILGCNLAVRPAVLEKVKGRDTRLGPGRGLSCEDIDFTYRVLRSGHRGVFLPTPVVYHEPGQRDRRREYLRGWGAFYIKFLLVGDLKVARLAWWKMHALWKGFRDGETDLQSTLSQVWHMSVGASIMMKRMVFSASPYE